MEKILLKGHALTEKGALKQAVRNGATEYVSKMLQEVKGVAKVDGKKNVLMVSFIDNDGNEFYTQISLSTSLIHPADKATKTTTKKTVQETISWE